ncbi:MAG: terminase gpA endonuclease subunit [Planctomycetota bacterium]
MQLTDIREAVASGIRSRTLTTPSRWVQERRTIPDVVTGEALPFGFKYHPWAREPHDSKAHMNVSMKAAQMGLTEVGINRAFYTLDVLQEDVLYVLPTSTNATDFSKARFNVALRHSPYLKRMFTDTNTVSLKQAGTSTLYIRGSRGDSNLKSIPVSTMILDEVDEMDQDQIWLAMKRLAGKIEKNVWAISTPTVPNRGIHKLFQPSTQEHFIFKCPCCSRRTELIWPDCIEIIGESIADPRIHESYLKCKECGGKLEHKAKPEWLASGKWEQTNSKGNKDYRGFYINELYSFTITPGEAVTDYMRGLGDEGAAAEFWKSTMGMPFIPDGGQVTETQIQECTRGYTKQAARPTTGGARLITMGVDQGDWLHVEVTEWFLEAFGKDLNSVAQAKVGWQGKFNVGADNGWFRLDELMREWQVLHCVVDADPATNEARQFARRFPGYVTLCRYRRGVPMREIKTADCDDYGTQIATVDRTSWLDISLGRFKTNRIQLPRDTNLEYQDHVQALVRTYIKDKDTGNQMATEVSFEAKECRLNTTHPASKASALLTPDIPITS